MISLFKSVVELQYPGGRRPGVRAVAADDEDRRADDGLRRCQASRLRGWWWTTCPSIQVDWSLYGPKLAQSRADGGRRRVDGVSAENDTGEGRRRAPLEEIRRNIVAAGQGSDRAQRTLRSRLRMTPVRLGAVEVLNARPLVSGLDRSQRFDLRYDLPSSARGYFTRVRSISG
jgi:hypothetical protein